MISSVCVREFYGRRNKSNQPFATLFCHDEISPLKSWIIPKQESRSSIQKLKKKKLPMNKTKFTEAQIVFAPWLFKVFFLATRHYLLINS